MKRLSTLLILLAAPFPMPLLAQAPPKVFVDKGACLFECCTYREWTVTAEVHIKLKDGKMGWTKSVKKLRQH